MFSYLTVYSSCFYVKYMTANSRVVRFGVLKDILASVFKIPPPQKNNPTTKQTNKKANQQCRCCPLNFSSQKFFRI